MGSPARNAFTPWLLVGLPWCQGSELLGAKTLVTARTLQTYAEAARASSPQRRPCVHAQKFSVQGDPKTSCSGGHLRGR